MGKFDNIGQLVCLPLESIQSEKLVNESEFIVAAAANSIRATDGRNWIPLIVKEIRDYEYEVVGNNFIYAVSHCAGLEKVWCIIIEPKASLIEQVKLLARETEPRINLANASRDTILSALRYVSAQPASPLKGVDLTVATNRIENSDRSAWKDLTPITKLSCGITKGKKLDALRSIFFIDVPPPPPSAPEIISIRKSSRNDIYDRFHYLETYKIGGCESLNSNDIADAIFTAQKTKWKSLNALIKLGCGIETKHIKSLKTVFSL
jgi:hypothetical protein